MSWNTDLLGHYFFLHFFFKWCDLRVLQSEPLKSPFKTPWSLNLTIIEAQSFEIAHSLRKKKSCFILSQSPYNYHYLPPLLFSNLVSLFQVNTSTIQQIQDMSTTSIPDCIEKSSIIYCHFLQNEPQQFVTMSEWADLLKKVNRYVC